MADVTNEVVSPAAVRRAIQAVEQQAKRYSPYKVLALASFPAVVQSVEKFAAIQSGVDLARVGCALERHRLAHGEYPAALDGLAPQFIGRVPHDVINGEPLHYRRTDDGRFVLYSVGWNETDDGGTAAVTKSGTVERGSGDWVWKYQL